MALCPGLPRMSWYQKDKTNLNLLKQETASGSGIICMSLPTDNHTNTSPHSFLQAGCLSCHATNSVKALKYNIPIT